MDGIIEILKPYLNVLLIGAVGFFLAFAVFKGLSRTLSRSLGSIWSRIVGSAIGIAIGAYTIELILDVAGATELLVVLATVVTAAFAFGSERTASDFIAGINLFFLKPYQVGDLISIAGHDGRVMAITLMQTTLESVYGDRIYIHNSDVIAGTIVNFSAAHGHLITSMVILPSTEDLPLAIEMIEKTLVGFSPEFEQSGFKPSVSVESGDPGYFNVEIHAYVPESLDYGPEKTRLFVLITTALKEAGMSLAPID